MEKIWLAHYPPGVPHDIDPTVCPTLRVLLEESAARYPERPAFEALGASLSYARLDVLSQRFASYLQNHAGLTKGDRVALVLPNLLPYPVALFGILRGGFVAVNCNPMYTAPELAFQLNDSGARAVVCLENFAATLEQALPQTSVRTVVLARLGDLLGVKGPLVTAVARHLKGLVPPHNLRRAVPFVRTLRLGGAAPMKDVLVEPDDVAFLQYTGGTTGVPKAAVLRHRHVAANVLQISANLGEDLLAQPQTALTALPLYHIFALTVNAFLITRLGGTNVLVPDPRNLPALAELMHRRRFTFVSGVNTLFNGLLHTPAFRTADFSALRFTVGGGAAVQGAVARRWKEVTGCAVIEGYGLTEASPVVSTNPIDTTEHDGSVGFPVPSTEISIRDEKDQELGLGEVGELCVRGPQVMDGYWQKPEETRKVMTDDGFLRTGDLARVDERGRIFIVDRKKDLILVSGFNVYPNELEAALAELKGVKEAAVVGIPDENSGEAVMLFIVPSDPGLTKEKVMEFCRERFTAYKRPHDLSRIEFRESLPKSNIGKILRRNLREEYLARARTEGPSP
jgi:long-chain acyl-CoA synthetase